VKPAASIFRVLSALRIKAMCTSENLVTSNGNIQGHDHENDALNSHYYVSLKPDTISFVCSVPCIVVYLYTCHPKFNHLVC
jgi:hypothetical protein